MTKEQLEQLGLSETEIKGVMALKQSLAEDVKSIDISEKVEKALESYNFNKETVGEIKDMLKAQGTEIANLRDVNHSVREDSFTTELKSAFEALKSGKGSATTYQMKAAGPVMSSSVPAIGLRFEIEPGIKRLDSKEPVIYDSLLKGSTNSAVINWVNYKPKEGGAAFIGEGELKPLKDWTYEAEAATPKKIAVRSKHPEELFDNFENFLTEVQGILTNDLVDERDTQLLLGDGVGANPKGIIKDAAAYIATGAVNGKIPMPNIADVIVAISLQIKNTTRGKADRVILNSYDAAMVKLTKNQFGNYLTPDLQALLSNIVIIESEDMPVGKVLVYDSRRHTVKNKKGIFMKTVYENDDMTRNLVGLVVEQYVYSYRSKIYNSSFVYDDIATVKAALTPAA